MKSSFITSCEIVGKYNGKGICGSSHKIKKDIISNFVNFLETKKIKASFSLDSNSLTSGFMIYAKINNQEFLIGSSNTDDTDEYISYLNTGINENEDINESLYFNLQKILNKENFNEI